MKIGIAFDLKPKTPFPPVRRTISTKSSTAPPPSRRSPSPFAKWVTRRSNSATAANSCSNC